MGFCYAWYCVPPSVRCHVCHAVSILLLSILCVGRIVNLDWARMNITGTADPAYGELTALQGLYLSHNTIAGPMPCSWGDLTQLRFLILENTNVTSLSPCMRGMRSLELFVASANPYITNLPAELGELSNITWFSFQQCNVSAPMINLANWTKLEVLMLNENHIYGSFPSLQAANATLRIVTVADNQLTDLPVNTFDNCPRLSIVDLGRNSFHSALPNFANSNSLTDLAFDHNYFVGGIPETWKMPNVQSVLGSHNQLTAPIWPLSTFTSMTYLDLR